MNNVFFFFNIINIFQQNWKIFMHLICLSVCACPNSRKYSSNTVKLIYVIHVWYRMNYSEKDMMRLTTGLNLHGSSLELSSCTSFFFIEFLYFRGNLLELINIALWSSLIWNSWVVIFNLSSNFWANQSETDGFFLQQYPTDT